jgi:hypothetical protein
MGLPLRTALSISLLYSNLVINGIHAKTDLNSKQGPASCVQGAIYMAGRFNAEAACDAHCADRASRATEALNRMKDQGLLPCIGRENFCATDHVSDQISTCAQCGSTRTCQCSFQLQAEKMLPMTEQYVLDGIVNTCGDTSRVSSLDAYAAEGFVPYSMDQEDQKVACFNQVKRCGCNIGGDSPSVCRAS